MIWRGCVAFLLSDGLLSYGQFLTLFHVQEQVDFVHKKVI